MRICDLPVRHFKPFDTTYLSVRSLRCKHRLALVSIYQTDVTSFSKMEEVLNGYVTNPNPTPTLTPNPNRNPNSNPNQINEKIQKETTLKIDQIT